VGAVVIERGDLTGEEWREAVAGAVRTARNRTDSVLVVIDEARFLAPERETTQPIPVRQFKHDGKTVGGEGIYSDLGGPESAGTPETGRWSPRITGRRATASKTRRYG
jgi:hypothetical protein